MEIKHYPDLKTYTLGEPPHQKIVKVVGWLNKEKFFTRGIVPAPILNRLWEFCKQPMGQGLPKKRLPTLLSRIFHGGRT